MSLPPTNQRLLTYVDALREAVAQEMRRDPRVFLFGLDVDDHKAIQGSTRGLVDEFRLRNADKHFHDHRVGGHFQRGRDVQRIVPKRVTQRSHRGLGVIGAAYIRAHADLEHHSFHGHCRFLS